MEAWTLDKRTGPGGFPRMSLLGFSMNRGSANPNFKFYA